VTALRIRAATASDAEAIARVHVQSWRETYRGLLPDAMLDALSVDQRAAMWRQFLADAAPAPILAVAEDAGGNVVGFGSAGPARGEALATDGEITAIYLLDSVKRRGLGRALFLNLRAGLAARGHASAGLWVLTGNKPACRFYAAMGGRSGAMRDDKVGDAVLTEIAYVWDDITARLPPSP
jgi:ribosomal protein S18 acetylase RimI-like enzyme